MPRDKRPIVGFVDDDPGEVEIFNRVFATDYRIVSGTRLKPVLDELGVIRNRPSLFIIDLYAPRGREATPQQRQKMVHLKQEVETAQEKLSSYLHSIGQDRSVGMTMIRSIRERHPNVPIIVYTRKGTLDDVDACRDAGAAYCLPKPRPVTLDDRIDLYVQLEQATQEHRQALSQRFEEFLLPMGIQKRVIKAAKVIWETIKVVLGILGLNIFKGS